MPKGVKEPNGLTRCENRFVAEYIQTGNATEAYERSYNPPSGRHVSQVKGCQKISRPHIRVALEEALAKSNVTPSRLALTLDKALDAQKAEFRAVESQGKSVQISENVPDHQVRLKAVQESCKILGAYAARESTSRRVTWDLRGEPPGVLAWIAKHGRPPGEKERAAICSGEQEPQEPRGNGNKVSPKTGATVTD